MNSLFRHPCHKTLVASTRIIPFIQSNRAYSNTNISPSPISDNILNDYSITGSIPNLSTYRPTTPQIQSDTNPFVVKGVRYEARPLYLDAQATTQVDPRVIDIMNHYNVQSYGNPHSRTHFFGFETEKAVENARKQVADLIGAKAKDIIFTSGATESNNLAIKGAAAFPRKKKKNHIITIETEHKCVLDSCRQLELSGFEVTYLPVLKSSGIVDLNVLKESIRKDTLLVSVMMVNNEIGTIQPMKEISEICHSNDVLLHCDGAQALGKVPVNVDELGIDIMSLSGHKIYGPKGIGAIYVRTRPRRVMLRAIISGGGQERNLRSGTLPAPLCIGFGHACAIAQECLDEDLNHVTRLYHKLYDGLTSNLVEIILNGDPVQRYKGNLNVSVSFVEGESLLMALKNVAVSSGSACTSASLEPSYVLRALGVAEDLAHTSVRFGLGRFTTDEEIDYTLEEMIKQVKRLRAQSPLYDFYLDGVDISKIEWTQH